MGHDECAQDRARHRARDSREQEPPRSPSQSPVAPGSHQARENHNQRIFPDIVEDDRSEESVERASDDAAHGHPEIEVREPTGLGTPGDQRLMTHQGGQEERREMDGQLEEEAIDAERQDGGAGRHRKPLQEKRGGVAERRAVLKGDDEGSEVQSERQHPDERRRRHVGRQIGGHAQHETRRNGGENQPG